jgi:hypothetical protein
MTRSAGLTHVAMSVPAGTLTDDFRAEVVSFYGRMLGWQEIESLRLPDRLTLAIGRTSYVNLRERTDNMVTHGYDHFGVLLGSADELRDLWNRLDAEDGDVHLEPLTPSDRGEGSFRFRHLLPLAVEAQFYASLV